MQRGTNLKDETGEGSSAVVAYSEARADGDSCVSRGEVDVEIVGGEGEGAAFGIGDGESVCMGGCGGRLRLGWLRVRWGAGVAGEEDLSVRRCGFDGVCWISGGWSGGASGRFAKACSGEQK